MSDTNLTETEKTAQLKRLEEVIRKHDSMLVGWLMGKTGDRETARDIAQDAYLRVWRFAHTTAIENPQALLFKTAANLAANEFRARRRMRTAHMDPPDARDQDPIQNMPCDNPSPEQASCAKSDVEISIQAIESLPKKVRRAFIMSRFQEMSYQEIATALGVSVSSVEKYMITALKSLRAALEDKNQSQKKVIAFPSGKRR